MSKAIDVTLYFNFRSPYCYLASHTMWPVFDDYDVNIIWKPVGGWDLRSSPDRAQVKVPLARQDLARFARRLGIKVTPPPKETEPTLAALGSLLAEEKGLLRPYIRGVMNSEWAEGNNIGDSDILFAVADQIGLSRDELAAAFNNHSYKEQLAKNAEDAANSGVIGVPTFVIGDQIFWGQDRIDFVLEELEMLTNNNG